MRAGMLAGEVLIFGRQHVKAFLLQVYCCIACKVVVVRGVGIGVLCVSESAFTGGSWSGASPPLPRLARHRLTAPRARRRRIVCLRLPAQQVKPGRAPPWHDGNETKKRRRITPQHSSKFTYPRRETTARAPPLPAGA